MNSCLLCFMRSSKGFNHTLLYAASIALRANLRASCGCADFVLALSPVCVTIRAAFGLFPSGFLNFPPPILRILESLSWLSFDCFICLGDFARQPYFESFPALPGGYGLLSIGTLFSVRCLPCAIVCILFGLKAVYTAIAWLCW